MVASCSVQYEGVFDVTRNSTLSWCVLRTGSRQEKILSRALGARDVGHYLPLVRTTRRYADREATVETPLFPGCVFLRQSAEKAPLAAGTREVMRIDPVEDPQQLQHELFNIHRALCRRAKLEPQRLPCGGTRARVRSGRLQGLQGIVEDPQHVQRLVLPIGILGCAVSVDLEGASIELLV